MMWSCGTYHIVLGGLVAVSLDLCKKFLLDSVTLKSLDAVRCHANTRHQKASLVHTSLTL